MCFGDLDLEERLLLARRGTAYLTQRVAELADDQLDDPSLLPTWSRRHVLAHVGYNAAALSRLLDWAVTGVETPTYASAEHRDTEIAKGATMDADELRNLVHQTAFRLDEKWRRLPPSGSTAQVRTAQGRLVSAAETVWMRSREVWIHAVDLDNGGQFGDFPPVVLESLFADIVTTWHRKAVSMQEIASEAGVGKGTLFRRFGSKARLMMVLLEEDERLFQEALLRGPAPLGPGAPQRRKRLHRKGGATYRLVRYADDFVVLVHGAQHHAEHARTEVAEILAPMGLALSPPKTRVLHIDSGFDFLGWHIQRRTKAGTTRKMVYTYPSKKSLHSIIGKVRFITRRSGSPYQSLEQLLKHLNPVVRGWCMYFRHGVSSTTFSYVYTYMWYAVARWLRARHPRLGWRKIQRRFMTGYPGHRPEEKGTVLYNPQEIAIERYRYRGYTIPTPWSTLAAQFEATAPA
jgi:uncharacterized protein (TIGR03083 family)